MPTCMSPRAWRAVGPGGLGSVQGLCPSLGCGLQLGGLSSGWLLGPLCQQGGDSQCLRKSMLRGEALRALLDEGLLPTIWEGLSAC